jgi:putative heme iron utilization protein
MTDDRARPARLLLRRTHRGVLSTFSTRFEGFPYGSAVPFVLDAHGHPVLLVSRLAAHTQDMLGNPAVSLTAHGDDVVTGARVTLLGRIAEIDRGSSAARRYLALLPEAEVYAGFGDFGFLRLDPVAGHYVGGFGDIRWFDGTDFLVPATALDDREDDIVAHMNEDHVDTMQAWCTARLGAAPGAVQMLCVDADGFDLRADDATLHFDFPEPVTDADAARLQFIRMARESRGG